MGKNRLEAFSDGVIAIIITIMVLGDESSARRQSHYARADRSRVSELYPQLPIRRYLLEQSSPYASMPVRE